MRPASISIRYQPPVSALPKATEGATESAAAQELNFQAPRRFNLKDQPWLGSRVPNGFWESRDNRVAYMTWLGQQCGFFKPADWYNARKHHFQRNHGGGLLRNEYGSSVLSAMIDLHPDFDWKPWLFGGAPNGFWKSLENRVWFMDWLGAELGFESVDEWYSVTGADFFQHHGGGLLNNQFNGSVQALLVDYKPDYPWKAWRFASVPQSYWRSPANRKNYLLWLGERLGFHTDGDWRKLRRDDFYKNEGSGLFVTHYRGSTQKALAELFPDKQPA